MSVACVDDGDTSWFTKYYQQQQLRRKNQRWRSSLHPSAFVAMLVIVGRIVVGPLILLLLFIVTSYLGSEATFLITADNGFFTFTERDLSMAGGCIDCVGPCKIVLLKYAMFNGNALLSAPSFAVFAGQSPVESQYNFSSLTPEALALGESLDSAGAICESGVNEWGSAISVVTSTSRHVLDVITTVKLSVSPQTLHELELGIELAGDCDTRWSIMVIPRQFFYSRNSYGRPESGKISAVAVNVFPEYAECRPDVPINDGGSRLAVKGSYVLPAFLALFPYSFKNSISELTRVVPAMNTKFGANSVLQPFMHAYYGGCRVREVSASAIYIEETCEMSEYWEKYGLMIQYPDDIPLCTTNDVCVHNYYNSQWEWVTEIVPERPNGVVMYVNTFQNRYADKVGISVLPGFVVMQIFAVGIVKAYQVMAHNRSVLLMQIWAYQCQNGQVQVVYLAQIAYHLLINSDLYLLGFATGTLTTESITNLACCFYAFSYSFVNLAKSRAGDQQLDRYFRLTWETIHVIVTACVVAALRVVQRNPLESLISMNAHILRKTSTLGAKYCSLNDACIIFTINTPTVVSILSAVLGLVAIGSSSLVKKLNPQLKDIVRSARLSITGHGNLKGIAPVPVVATTHSVVLAIKRKEHQIVPLESLPTHEHLTSFEENCLGSPFKKLFHDCDDIAYVMYNGTRCSTAEALLLTGYLCHGEHIYQATSVPLLVLARWIPQKVLRSFNVLILRWHFDPKTGKLTHALSCTWFTTGMEKHSSNGTTPVA